MSSQSVQNLTRGIIRENPTITPVAPCIAAFTASAPATIASSRSTSDWKAILARPHKPGFSLQALYPSF